MQFASALRVRPCPKNANPALTRRISLLDLSTITKRGRTGVLLGNRRIDDDAINSIPDSTGSWRNGDLTALRQRLADDGVILIRGLIPHDEAVAARKILLKTAKDKQAIADDTDYCDGVIARSKNRRLQKGFTATRSLEILSGIVAMMIPTGATLAPRRPSPTSTKEKPSRPVWQSCSAPKPE